MGNLVFADQRGQIADHPTLEMGGASGSDWVRIPDKELITLPEGARLFTMPGAHPVGWNTALCTFEAVKAVGRWEALAVAAFLPPGYMRTHLPATFAPSAAPYLPLWAYTAVGWRDGQFVTAAVRVDSMDHQEP